MIASSIFAQDDLARYPEAIRRALGYLSAHDFTAMAPGVYEIQGKDIFAQVFDVTTAPRREKKPEFHREYIDVQFLASGEEYLGYAPDKGRSTVVESHPDTDLYFYDSAPDEMLIKAVPGSYTIFFPNDIHCPGIMGDAPKTVRKVVVKVRESLIRQEKNNEKEK